MKRTIIGKSPSNLMLSFIFSNGELKLIQFFYSLKYTYISRFQFPHGSKCYQNVQRSKVKCTRNSIIQPSNIEEKENSSRNNVFFGTTFPSNFANWIQESFEEEEKIIWDVGMVLKILISQWRFLFYLSLSV